MAAIAHVGEQPGIVFGMGCDRHFIDEARRTVDHERRQPLHAAERGGLLEGGEQFPHREMVVAGARISVFAAPGGERGEEFFPLQFRAVAAVGEPVFEDDIEPLLQQCGAAIPVKRMLKHDDVVGEQQALFASDIHMEIRIRLIEVVKRHAGNLLGGSGQAAVDARFLKRRMGEENEDTGRHVVRGKHKRPQGKQVKGNRLTRKRRPECNLHGYVVPHESFKKLFTVQHMLGAGQSMAHVNTTTSQPNFLMRALLLGAMALTLALPAARASGRWATLEAIHHLENPRNLTRPGPKGELGAYQFRASTWRMHTTVPFARAINREESDVVAVRHYEWLRRELERAGVPATPYMIALAWNGGLDGAISGRAPAIAHDYARRAVNLAESLDRMANAGVKVADAR